MAVAQRHRVLLVEDDPDLRECLRLFLEDSGLRVVEAESGNQAFDALKSEPVDLVLSDVRMPDGDGMQLLQRIRAEVDNPPPTILMTGFADLERPRALAAGARDLIRKPFDPVQLLRSLDWLLP
jgi:DNA-binding response OmpR family regulator